MAFEHLKRVFSKVVKETDSEYRTVELNGNKYTVHKDHMTEFLMGFLQQVQYDNHRLLKQLRNHTQTKKNVLPDATDIYGDNYDWENDPCGLNQLGDSVPKIPGDSEEYAPEDWINTPLWKLWLMVPQKATIEIHTGLKEGTLAVVKCIPRDVPLITHILHRSFRGTVSITWNVGDFYE